MKKTIFTMLTALIALNLMAKGSVADKPLTMAEIKADKSINEPVKFKLDNLRDPAKAEQIAKKEGKILMLHFTGSSWCPPCKYLEAKVLNTPDFIKFARGNVAYVNMDFTPRGASVIDTEYAKPYLELAAKYNLTAFPTVILINPNTNKTDIIVGVETETPAKLVARIEKLKAAKPSPAPKK